MASDGAPAIAANFLARLPSSPDIYPQGLDLIRQAILLIELDADGYRTASFLDDRILTAKTRGTWVRFDRVAATARTLADRRPLHFVFHTGHVGSTLVSRLLDETNIVLPLREPLPLRVLAGAHDTLGLPESLVSEAEFASLLGVFDALWSRGYAWTHSVVLKATSSAARLAVPLLEQRPDARAICLSLRPEPYLATLLAGQNSPIDLRWQGPERMRRLMHTLNLAQPRPLHGLSLGELAAMSWLAETATHQEIARRFADRIVPVDFDALLNDVPGSMARIASHFGLPVDHRFQADIARSPTLARYSKAPEHPYTVEMRAQILADARRTHATELRKGLLWLESIARDNQVAAALIQSAA